MPDEFRLTPLRAGDAARLAQLHTSLFAPGWSRADFIRFAHDPITGGFAAYSGQVLAGMVIVRAAADEAEILTLAVATAWRRRGLGRVLVKAASAWAAGRGARRIFLEVAENNAPAVTLYDSLGFTCVGRRKHYYKNANNYKDIDALVLELQLAIDEATLF